MEHNTHSTTTKISQIEIAATNAYLRSTLLLETLLDDVAIERVAIRRKEAALHERRRVVNLVFFRLLLQREVKVRQSQCAPKSCVFVRAVLEKGLLKSVRSRRSANGTCEKSQVK